MVGTTERMKVARLVHRWVYMWASQKAVKKVDRMVDWREI